MKILLSNDDGYHAKGLAALASAVESLADTVIVAPDRNQSGASHSLTLDAPLRVGRTEEGVYFVNGTPTDCVHLAITGLLDFEPDMVVAGINHGSNLGDDVLYSGTVAAAMEGRFLGLPSIAVSLNSFEPGHFETAADVVVKFVEHLQKQPLKQGGILSSEWLVLGRSGQFQSGQFNENGRLLSAKSGRSDLVKNCCTARILEP